MVGWKGKVNVWLNFFYRRGGKTQRKNGNIELIANRLRFQSYLKGLIV